MNALAPQYDRVLDQLDAHGIDISVITPDMAAALEEVIGLIGEQALGAFAALVGSRPAAQDLTEQAATAFLARYIGTYPDRHAAALAVASVPGGLLDGVRDVQATAVYFDTERFLDDMSTAAGPLVVLGDGPVHVLWRRAPRDQEPPF